eukprot:5722943-Pleurochrysis_carterae.AAC.1
MAEKMAVRQAPGRQAEILTSGQASRQVGRQACKQQHNPFAMELQQAGSLGAKPREQSQGRTRGHVYEQSKVAAGHGFGKLGEEPDKGKTGGTRKIKCA